MRVAWFRDGCLISEVNLLCWIVNIYTFMNEILTIRTVVLGMMIKWFKSCVAGKVLAMERTWVLQLFGKSDVTEIVKAGLLASDYQYPKTNPVPQGWQHWFAPIWSHGALEQWASLILVSEIDATDNFATSCLMNCSGALCIRYVNGNEEADVKLCLNDELKVWILKDTSGFQRPLLCEVQSWWALKY